MYIHTVGFHTITNNNNNNNITSSSGLAWTKKIHVVFVKHFTPRKKIKMGPLSSAPNPKSTAVLRSSSTFQPIDTKRGTILFDEIDNYITHTTTSIQNGAIQRG